MRLVDADKLKAKQQEDADLFIGDNTLSGKSRRDEALNAVANIVNAPTIDPVKYGKWNEHHQPFTWMGYTTWTCSECDYECGYEKEIGFRTSYCPNCGAKMDK